MVEPRAMPTKAILLAAGKGTRLRPLTDAVSKCMVEVAGKPILEHNVERLRAHGVTEIIINLHHRPDSITAHFGDGSRWGLRITYSFEPELLGTAGAVKKAAADFDVPFFVWYGDNLSDCRLDRLWRSHTARGGIATIALHHRDDPTQSGIVGLGTNDRVVRFLEKPRAEQVFSHWVSAGILVLEPDVLRAIARAGAADFGRDVFPALLDQGAAIYGYRMAADEHLWWVDTPADYQSVQSAPVGLPEALGAEEKA
ncbi:MAG TPA: nucleotidyltransferase family protein [Blastocatellia bacterium]|nr:nucleotidyltransferase family protein [Blastocatellia bacterium]